MGIEQYINRELKVDIKHLIGKMTDLEHRDKIISELIEQVKELRHKNERQRVAIARLEAQ